MDGTAYQACRILITAGLVLTVLEGIATYFMLPILGTVGIPVFFKTLRVAPGVRLLPQRGVTTVGGRQLRLLPRDGRAILSTLRGRSSFSARSSWPFKCTIQLDSSAGLLKLVASMPFGLPVLMAGWFIPFIGDRDTSMIVIGLVLVAIFVSFEIYRSLDSAMSVARGLNAQISGPAA